eukprot:7253634-Prymnesium_polylepis.1
MSNMDVPLQLHFALFSSSSGGFVLKPPEMRVITPIEEDGRTTIGQDGNHPDQLYLHWPPSRKRLFCATIRVLSLHTCPKVAAQHCMHFLPCALVPTLLITPAQTPTAHTHTRHHPP